MKTHWKRNYFKRIWVRVSDKVHKSERDKNQFLRYVCEKLLTVVDPN